MIDIFVSKKHDYSEQAYKLLNTTKSKGRVHFIEEILANSSEMPWDNLNTGKNIVYFICNDSHIQSIIEKAGQAANFINSKYYALNWNKEQVFIVLQNWQSSIKIPTYYDEYTDIKDNEYPVWVKFNNHQGITFKADSKDMIRGFKIAANLDYYYFEQNIANSESKEIKVFYINGKVYPADKNKAEFQECCKYNPNFIEDLNKIARKFKLEACSVDIIFDKENQYLIDLNPAPAFYSSKMATKDFTSYLLEKEQNE